MWYKESMKKHIAFLIITPIVYLLLFALVFFYLDMASGPIAVTVLGFLLLALLLGALIFFFRKPWWTKLITWVAFFALLIPIVANAHPYEGKLNASYSDSPKATAVLHIENGDIRGVYNQDETVEVYAGIPFAKAPVGDLRWKEPQDPEDWEGVRDCSYFAPKAMQADSNPVMDSLVSLYAAKTYHPDFSYTPLTATSEDCLYLNVWKPAGEQHDLPVLLYIHGGSLTSGRSSFESYNGAEIAKRGVIMITIAYRLGVFGYFAHPNLALESPNGTTGNYGLLDQIKSLEWVQENIAHFGGDKNNVTIAGESAGSSSVSALCVSPLATGLFRRAIAESSSLILKNPPHTFRSMKSAQETGKKILEEFRCQSIEDLRKIDAETLVKTQYSNSGMTVDGYALPSMAAIASKPTPSSSRVIY